ncbi:DUF4129 domain-containing protein [Pedobacter sp. AW31-3R]|uniref:DUF4129 domain-containing protein n=1 Tax=Pedobacter sp. AW31-3R TaxID=3445781 RepID=UPI003FA05C04
MNKLLLFVLLIYFSFSNNPVFATQRIDTTIAAEVTIGAKKEIDVPKKNPFRKDSSTVAIRNFDQQKLNAYHEQSAFKYDTIPLQTNYWNWFWSWIKNILKSLFDGQYSGYIINYLLMIVSAAVVVFAILKLMGLDMVIFSRKSKSVKVPYSASDDNIHEIDFNHEIESAVNAGNYRLAVRLLYLHALKKLNDNSMIHWQPEKTNQTYIDEITDTGKKQEFSLLTRQFEYIWYGEFFIDRENFTSVQEAYHTFNRGIQ